MQQQQPGSYTLISVPYWSLDVCLGLELLWDIQFGLPAIYNSLASYENNYISHECIYMTRSGRGNQKLSGALCAPVAKPPFLISKSATARWAYNNALPPN